ncbi:MAG: glycosyltransferase family 39 protein [Deltaproteobacteria bacterium]|jgi:4-amino-4-deoxy-L-arabinose transferase-like glycosyltransferase|nr:glycosyltransferase family 39 protein [Deltaproteobacteria bacterium]MDX9762694.1 glycosyltransferase family 39 protein [Desulfomonilia bacterium]
MIVTFFCLSLLLIPGINHGLWRPDEPREAGICAEMARTRDFVVPHLNGIPFLEKPPLYYAMAAVSGSLLGVDKDIPYRLISLLFAALTLFITYSAASLQNGSIVGLIAAGILASSGDFFKLSRWIQVDNALVFGVALAMYAYLKIMKSFRIRDSALLGVAIGISFMAKGFVGPAIIASAVIADTLCRRDITLLWKTRPHIILACAGIIILPWIVVLWDRGGWAFVREIIVVNNIMRFTGAPEGAALGHQNGFFFYFTRFPLGFLPWTLLFIPALIAALKEYRHNPYVSWLVGPIILLTISSTKRGVYLVPLFSAAACMTAWWLSKAQHMKWEETLLKATWGIAVLACFIPFAGIFLGLPVYGAILGTLAVSFLAYVIMFGINELKALSLVLIMSIALGAGSCIYFDYMKPHQDYLAFARQALTISAQEEITILEPDEIMEGVLPMVSGKRYPMAREARDIRSDGMYVWVDKNDKVLRSLQHQAEVKILFERKMGVGGRKTARLAYVLSSTPQIKGIRF